MESNIPKTATNAAKIYFRLKQDNENVHSKFQGSKLITFLESLSGKDIDDNFNPFKMKDKWAKFFRGGLSKPVLDTDRVLKNQVNDALVEYVNDEFSNFNDSQLIRCALVLSMTQSKRFNKTRDRVLDRLIKQIFSLKF